MRKVLLLAAALAIPVSGVTMLLTTGQAVAKGGPKGKVTCTTFNGNLLGNVQATNCTDTNGATTGTSSMQTSASALATGGTITWANGSTMTFGAPVSSSTNPKKCPGYVKNGNNNPSAVKFSAQITADNGANLKIPGKMKGAICLSPSDQISALKPVKIS